CRAGPGGGASRVLLRKGGGFPRRKLPARPRCRARRAARRVAARPAHLRLQPGALEGQNIRPAPREDTSMVRCFPPLLTLVILLAGSPASATGPLGPEIRFFSPSVHDPQDDL